MRFRVCAWLMFVMIACAAGAPCARAQCEFDWLPGEGIPGVDGSVTGIVEWDPDGAGPAKSVVVVAGNITLAGSTKVSGVAAWDGSQWFPISAPTTSGTPTAIAVDGIDLYVAYEYPYNPPLVAPPAKVFRNRNGQWESLLDLTGDTFTSTSRVSNFMKTDQGMLIRGSFSNASYRTLNGSLQTVHCNGIVRESASGWEYFDPSGLLGGTNQLLQLPDGRFVRKTERIHIIEGADYFALGGNSIFWASTEYAFLWRGELHILGSEFINGNSGPQKTVLYRWLGNNEPYPACFERKDLPPGFFPPAAAGIVIPNEDSFVAIYSNRISVWDGANASGIESFRGTPTAAAITSLGLAAASDSKDIGIGGHRIASYGLESGTWQVWGSGFNGPVRCITELNGELYVAGEFSRAGSVSANRIARLRNGKWEALGTGLDGYVRHIVAFDGSVFVSGDFTSAGGVPDTKCFARWTGTDWRSIAAFKNASWPARDAKVVNSSLLLTLQSTSSTTICARLTWDALTTIMGANDSYGNNTIVSVAPFSNGTKALIFAGSSSYFENLTRSYEYDGSQAKISSLITPYQQYFSFSCLRSDGNTIFDVYGKRFWSGGTAWTKLEPCPANDIQGFCVWNGGTVFGGSSLFYRSPSGSVSSIGEPPIGPFYSCFNSNGKLLVGGDFTQTPKNVSAYLATYAPVDNGVKITAQPTDVTGCWYRNASFSVETNGMLPITYQWRKNGVPLVDGVTGTGSKISGSKSRILFVQVPAKGKLTSFDSGDYDCVVTNPCATELSWHAHLEVVGSDLNCNRTVDDADFQQFSAAYDLMLCTAGGMTAGCPSDFNADGVVDDADFEIFVMAYNKYFY